MSKMDTKTLLLSLKVLSVFMFLSVVLISLAGILVMIGFSDVVSMLYSLYFMLPVLMVLLIICVAATLALTVASMQASKEVSFLPESVTDYLRDEGYL